MWDDFTKINGRSFNLEFRKHACIKYIKHQSNILNLFDRAEEEKEEITRTKVLWRIQIISTFDKSIKQIRSQNPGAKVAGLFWMIKTSLTKKTWFRFFKLDPFNPPLKA